MNKNHSTNEESQVAISGVKGRPMLVWVGKRPLRHVTAFPAQHIETFAPPLNSNAWEQRDNMWQDWPKAYPRGGLLFHGDNKEVLAHLLANGFRGKVNLIYIDPPFDSGADYVRKVQLRGVSGAAKIEGESYSLGEQIQYTDIWTNDNYLQFMYERLILMKELLDDVRGMICLQCDWRKTHHLRCLLDEVFGADNFRGEILVRAGTKNVQSQFEEVSALSTGHNSIFVYSKSRDMRLPKLVNNLEGFEPGKWDTFWRGTDRHTLRYPLFGQTPSSGQWRWKRERAERAILNYQKYLQEFANRMSLDEYYLHAAENHEGELDFVRKDDSGTVQYYVPPRNYKLLSNVWFDLAYRGTRTNYPTEKHQEPIVRLVEWITQAGDLLLDCFIGSGTTCAVAQRLGRRWIACDINKGAVQTTSRRLQTVIHEQIKELGKPRQLNTNPAANASQEPAPAQLAFTVHRVNDYDLAIQHNEAVNLACEHIGIERTYADSYFDGLMDRKLAKIIPLGHPLTPLDLEEVKRELEARPDEDRSVVLVCLGKELAADAWLEDWNRLRKGKKAVNRMEVIELRTDARYGKFFAHQPASARVTIKWEQEKLQIDIEDFISPSILQRLSLDGSLSPVKITDWRSMVDCVLIDTDFDGKVFNVAFSDVPQKKDHLVKGAYTLRLAPAGSTTSRTVAVKIIDMLGEEVLVTQPVG